MASKILVIEDDAAFRETVANILTHKGFAVSVAPTGKAGARKATASPPDLVLLDLVLPGMSGLDVCQTLKQETATAGVPILMLTGHDKEGQEVVCLDMGADDYLTKPVKTERLVARCRALLRRAQAPARGQEVLSLGPMRLSYEEKVVTLGAKTVSHLTPKEFELLYELASSSPTPQNRDALYRKVWEMEPPSAGSLKTVEVHIRRIRLKMSWRCDQWIVAVSGRGYFLKPPA